VSKKPKPRYPLVRKKSKIHGKGLFAEVDIPKGKKIIRYVGKKINHKQSDKISDKQLKKSKKSKEGSVYLFTLSKKFDLDGNVKYNTARLINHSCGPNCESDVIKGKVWIVSHKKIKAGTELTYDYGFNIHSYEDHLCKCGHKKCLGYIVSGDKKKKLRKRLKKDGVI